jgi:threonine/homoserine/homoserine lactone efflux protein
MQAGATPPASWTFAAGQCARVFASYLAAVALLALLALVPGPDVAVVTRYALIGGRRAGSRAVFGVIIGLLVWGTLTVVGLAAILAASSTAYTLVKVAGATYLVFLGLRALWRSRRGSDAGESYRGSPGGHPLRTGLMTNLLNPKIAVFYASVLPSLVPHGALPIVWLPILVLTHVLLSLLLLTGYSAVFSRSRSVLDRPRVRRLIDAITGVVLIGFGVRVAIETR